MEFIVCSELKIISNSHRNMYQRFIDDPSAGPSSTVAMTPGELEPSSLKSTTSKSSCENRTSAHNFLHAKKTSGRKYTVSIVLICTYLAFLYYSSYGKTRKKSR
ncbi:uncharacterized protein LOC132947368 [Metopolophium dirhodum]|uniref:uncharacterized protein LOC132947368 n=1 Tax=Metopolophium dirhodum TaxID=44670 RepID=UPI00298F40E1|nr:uncharacterized protein LOC132947368 [Metopolophium dirhodum]